MQDGSKTELHHRVRRRHGARPTSLITSTVLRTGNGPADAGDTIAEQTSTSQTTQTYRSRTSRVTNMTRRLTKKRSGPLKAVIKLAPLHESSQKRPPQHRRRDRRVRGRFYWHEGRLAVSDTSFPLCSCHICRLASLGARLSLARMGNVALLRESYEGDRARAARKLITSGPYRISRNPLYLGGNVFIFFGAALVLGSPSALILIALHLPLMDLFIRREERQLERTFGQEWMQYKNQVRRWI